MSLQPLARDSTHVIELSGFRDTVSGTYPTDGVGTLVLYNPDGSPLVSNVAVTRDVTTSGADTIYRGELASTVVLVKGLVYEAALTVVVSGKQRTFRVSCPVPV